jgi:sphinganine-1-phosphate aldolase
MPAEAAALLAALFLAAWVWAAPPGPGPKPARGSTTHALPWLDAALRSLPPSTAFLLGAGIASLAAAGLWLAAGFRSSVRAAGGWGRLALAAAAAAPGPLGRAVRAELDSVRAQVAAAVPPRPAALGPPRTALPATGQPPGAILKALRAAAAGDGVRLATTPNSRASGTLYLPGGEHARLLAEAYAAHAHSNPMHASAFPAAVSLERDVVAMAASLVGGTAPGVTDVGGFITSGGSESILTAVLSARNLAARSWRGLVTGGGRLDLVLASSAHPAFHKAAAMFGLRTVVVPVRSDGRLHAGDVAAALTRRTALVVASAVSFPHGVLDQVADIARVCAAAGVPLHVDACLGGFVLPFRSSPRSPTLPTKFGFDAGQAVASVSIDPHKFGLSHKGVSVILLRGEPRRRAAYSVMVDWPGGLYASPGLPGSRSGALVAAAWAALVHQGAAGLAAYAASIYAAVATVKAAIEGGPLAADLAILGDPVGPVIAFTARVPGCLNVWALGDALAAKGWRLSALTAPPALHMCFTPASVGSASSLVEDLVAAVSAVKQMAAAAEGGGKKKHKGAPSTDASLAPLYGQATKAGGSALGRAGVSAFLELYQDALVTGGGGGGGDVKK